MKDKTLTNRTIKSAVIHHFLFAFVIMLSFLFSDDLPLGLFFLIVIYSTILILPLFSFIYLVYNVVLFTKSKGLLIYYLNYFIVLFIILILLYFGEMIIYGGFRNLQYLINQYLIFIIYSFTLSIFNYFIVIRKQKII